MSEIRKLSVEDVQEFRSLRLHGLEEIPLAFSTNADDWRAADDGVVENLLEENPYGCVFGAFESDVLVGLVGVKRERRDGLQHKVSLWGLYVDESFRNRGIGRTLVEVAIADAEDRDGVEMLRLVAPDSAEKALRLFERVGFERYGTEPRARVFDGQYVDQHYFCRFV